jgi:hypothetical protein
MKTIVNVETNEIIERELNEEEVAQNLKDLSELNARQAEADARAIQRQLLLDRLGITQDEANLLLG